MSPLQILIGVLLAVVALALLAWFARFKRTGANRRLAAMLTQVGVDPGVAASADTEHIMREVRRRCRRCQTEDVCERWLAGRQAGGSDFCPNAEVLEALARSGQGS